MNQVKILFPKNYFKSNSEYIALIEVLTSYNNFIGNSVIGYDYDYNSKRENVQILYEGKLIEEIHVSKEGIDANLQAQQILNGLAKCFPALLPTVNCFFSHDLFNLDFLCRNLFIDGINEYQYTSNLEKNYQAIIENLLKSYPESLPLQKSNNTFTSRMNDYYDYLRLALKINNHNLKRWEKEKMYHKYLKELRHKYYLTNDEFYLKLQCHFSSCLQDVTISQEEPITYYTKYMNLKYRHHDEEEFFKACASLVKYYKTMDIFGEKNFSKLRHYYSKIIQNYGVFHPGVEFYQAIDELANTSMYNNFNKLNKKFDHIGYSMNSIFSPLWLLIYQIKVKYHLGVLELKRNNELLISDELLRQAFKIFETTLMNVLKRLNLYDNKDLIEILLIQCHVELIINYLLEACHQAYSLEEKVKTRERCRKRMNEIRIKPKK